MAESPEMDLSFFGAEAIEKVKQYAVEAAENAVVATPLDSLMPIAEIESSGAANVQIGGDAEAQPLVPTEDAGLQPTPSTSSQLVEIGPSEANPPPS